MAIEMPSSLRSVPCQCSVSWPLTDTAVQAVSHEHLAVPRCSALDRQPQGSEPQGGNEFRRALEACRDAYIEKRLFRPCHLQFAGPEGGKDVLLH